MKFSKLAFLAATTLLVGVVACKKEDNPSPKSSDEPATLTTLTDSEINGTKIESTTTVAGLIKNAKTGKGIAGVPVTDGYTYVKTDVNGVYQMKTNSRTRKVYYSIPADYKVALNTKNHFPAFYSPDLMVSGKKYRADFTIEPLDTPESEFTLLMVGDPQCYQSSEVLRYKQETVADLVKTSVKYPNCYAVTLGDITHDSSNLWGSMVSSMSNVKDASGRYLPFFQCIGNHDHNSLSEDTSDNDLDDYNAQKLFVTNCGPTDYSFNRGDAHIVVMDDIMVTSLGSSSKPNGKTWSYIGGFSDAQYAWFKADLDMVENKGEKVGFLCLHIPMRGGSNESGASVSKSRHYADFLNLMKQFKEFHIMIGHTHYQQNYINTNYKCVGGDYIYEHIHGAACGAWWSSDCNVTGGPNGYSIYTVKGANVANWKMKGANKEENYQLRVYDGTQTFSGTKGYKYYWYNSANTYLGVTAKGFAEANGAFVAEVFDDDRLNWKVEFWQDGVKKGNFTRRADGGFANITCASFFFNEAGKTTDSYTSTTASHYWYYKPEGGAAPASLKNWEVRAVFTVPTNPSQVNTYTCNKLTTTYDEFQKK